MDKINKFSNFSSSVINKFVPIIVFLVIVNVIFEFLKAQIDFSTWIGWWESNGGKTYKSTFDIYSMAYFSKSMLLFNIEQLLKPGTVNLNYTDIMLLQSIIINNARIDQTTIQPNQFVQPQHICQGIAWNDGDIDLFRQGIDSYYYMTDWYNAWVANGKPGPDDAGVWTNIMGYSVGGFWPHQNGCYNFFDFNKDSTIVTPNPNYGLTAVTNITLPKSIKLDKTQITYYYRPNALNAFGSWAQLFADFGIVYTQSSINPDKSTSITQVPVLDNSSDIDVWYASGYNSSTGYGPNFMGLYKINPVSYTLTSWVSNLYNDSKSGQKLDPQAFKNLIGMQPGALKATVGGWIKFFKGINTTLYSYDEIMNDLFATYSAVYTIIPPPPANKCNGVATGVATAQGACNGAAAGIMFGPEGAVIGFILGGLFSGLTASKDCPGGIGGA